MKNIQLLFNPAKTVKLFLVCGILLTFFACDPSQVLRIENKTNATANVKFVFKKGNGMYKFNEPGTSDTLYLELAPTDNNIREYHFAMGTWKIQSSLDSLISEVESIEIETANSKEIFQGPQQVRTFFESRITGSKKELIEIVLE